jgi:hypothetical protein
MIIKEKTKLFEGRNNKLLFIGSNHTISKDEQIFLESQVEEFKPGIILLEGGWENPHLIQRSKAIQIGKEMGFMNYIANKNKIPLAGNDPDYMSQVLYITKTYGVKKSFVYFMLIQWTHHQNFDSYIITDKGFQEELLKRSGIETFDFSLENFQKLIKEEYHEGFNKKKNYYNYFHPYKKINHFNEITVTLTTFRDKFMMEQIKKFMNSHKNILCIKGSGHLDMNINELHALME